MKRHLGPEDARAVAALRQAACHAGVHRLMPDEPAYILLARQPGGQRVLGFANVNRGDDGRWSMEVVLDPTVEPRPAREDLTSAGVRLAAGEGGGAFELWAHDAGPDEDDLAAAEGLAPARDLYQMRRSLPAEERDGLATRPFAVGRDEAAWLRVNNRAFAGHPDQGAWTMERLRGAEAESWFDADGLLLHEREGRLAGFCWTKVVDEAGPATGELYVLAVDPDFQGKGLGRRLVVAGLDRLSRLGLSSAMLYVDASNRPAVALYESLGFGVDHVDRAYAGVVPPINVPST